MLLERAPLVAAAAAAILLMSTALWLAYDLRAVAEDADVSQAQAILAQVRPESAPLPRFPKKPPHSKGPAGHKRPGPRYGPGPHDRPPGKRPPRDRLPHGPAAPAASSVLQKGRGLGVTYAAISFAGKIVDEAGTAQGKDNRPFSIERGDGWVRTVFPQPMRPPANLDLKGPPQGQITLEFEPLASENLRSHAIRLVVICLFASVLLLVFGVFVSRSARQQARLSERAERDRRLASLGEMSAVMAHEIRNPLTALKGHAQLLAEQLEGSEEHEGKIARVVSEAERLELLTRNLLDFVKTGTLDCAPSNPIEVVTSAAGRVPGLQLNLRHEGEPRDLQLDAERLCEALVNIFENASQAAPGVPVDVDVFFKPMRVEIRIRDHGPGFAAGTEEEIFQPFNTSKVKGVGLGLAIARRIVQAHQGQLTAQNHPEGGAVMSVVLEQVES